MSLAASVLQAGQISPPIDLSKYDEAVVIGFVKDSSLVDVVIKPRCDGTINKSELLETLKVLVYKLEHGAS